MINNKINKCKYINIKYVNKIIFINISRKNVELHLELDYCSFIIKED